jgi:hypothetical protein
MQGFIHLLLEAYVSETIGAQHLRPIRQMAHIPGPPLATQHYPDQMTMQLLQAVADYQGVALDDLLYHFGVYFMKAPLMHQHYRPFLEGHTSARSLLEDVPMIHRHLGKTFKEASLPELRYINHAPELLEIVYDSPRRLCRFLRGILDGVSQQFNEPLEVREMECQLRGSPACRILVRFLPHRRSGPLPESPSLVGAQGSGPYHAGGAGESGRQRSSGALPEYPFSPIEAPAPAEALSEATAKRQRDEDADLLILQTLASRQTLSRPLKGENSREQPLDLALSLFEVAQWLTASGVPPEYTRLSLLQRSLTRLAVQGFIESKLDPQARQHGASPVVAALGGQGILAAQRYRITPAGQAWLRDALQRRRAGG